MNAGSPAILCHQIEPFKPVYPERPAGSRGGGWIPLRYMKPGQFAIFPENGRRVGEKVCNDTFKTVPVKQHLERRKFPRVEPNTPLGLEAQHAVLQKGAAAPEINEGATEFPGMLDFEKFKRGEGARF